MSEKLQIDFGDSEALVKIEQSGGFEIVPTELTVFFPLPSFGKSNSHIDLTDDLLDASFGAESLAAFATSASAEFAFSNPDFLERVKLTLLNPQRGIFRSLRESLIIFNGDDEEELAASEIPYSNLRDRIGAFEDNISHTQHRVPEIVDWYFAELIGAYYEIASESPDRFAKEIGRFPERRLHFFKSAFSDRLEAPCYASFDSWLIPAELSMDKFFATTGQKLSLSQFEVGKVLLIDNASLAVSDSQIVTFSLSQYYKSRVVASLVESEPYSEMDRFAWTNATFSHSPEEERLRLSIPESLHAPPPRVADCLIHESGDIVCVCDGSRRHLLYGAKSLNIHQVKLVLEALTNLTGEVSNLAGISQNVICDWSSLDTEQFESLCYDILFAHPHFDSETIHKLGKSRSRDGGRDIIVYDRPKGSEKPKKWIFQCKLIRDGSSLTTRKLQDVGDMLEQYVAHGFGVMTSAVIDATLYDKLEKVCGGRQIDQRHFFVF